MEKIHSMLVAPGFFEEGLSLEDVKHMARTEKGTLAFGILRVEGVIRMAVLRP